MHTVQAARYAPIPDTIAPDELDLAKLLDNLTLDPITFFLSVETLRALTQVEFDTLCKAIPQTVTSLTIDEEMGKPHPKKFPDLDFSILQKLNLKRIKIGYPSLTDYDLHRLVHQIGEQLEELDITSCSNVTNVDGCNLRNLKVFTCSQTAFTDQGLQVLSTMCSDTLEVLKAWSCNISTFKNCSFTSLKKVTLQNGLSFDNIGLQELSRCSSKTLRKLDLEFTGVSSFEQCAFEALEQLNVATTDITDDGLMSISNACKTLRDLDISGCDKITSCEGITFSNAVTITRHKTLNTLILPNTESPTLLKNKTKSCWDTDCILL